MYNCFYVNPEIFSTGAIKVACNLWRVNHNWNLTTKSPVFAKSSYPTALTHDLLQLNTWD